MRMTDWRSIAGRLAAEFAIVVLGVTIALWADGWVADRADRAHELARLEALQINISSTLDALSADLRGTKGAIDALRKIAAPGRIEMSRENWQGTLRYGLLFGSEFVPEMNVYDDLKSSGELALLTNANLRQYLAKMDAEFREIELAQADLGSVQQSNIDTYLVDNLDLRAIYDQTLGLADDADHFEFDRDVVSSLPLRNRALLKLDILMWLEETLQASQMTLEEVAMIIRHELDQDTPPG